MKGAPGLGSMAGHLAVLERQRGRPAEVVADAEAERVEYPFVLEHVWLWFNELGGRRTGHGAGPNPLSHTEVIAWATLREICPTPEEVQLLMRLDAAVLASTRETKA